ncbi:MAG: ABC transporter ATP-binding protein [Candidatus Omnitrophica bacterium]|nr:ABC transporter ATP-binding protein [Candidatus Omnitrophota bacterium]
MESSKANDIKGFRQHARLLWYFFRNYRSSMCGIAGIMFFSGLLESLNLAAIYPILNYGLQLDTDNIQLRFLNNLIEKLPFDNLFLSSCIFLMIITVFSSLFRVFQHFLSNRLIMRVVKNIQNAIFAKYKNADYQFYVQNQQGKMVYAGTVAPLGASHTVFYVIRLMNSIITASMYTVLLIILSWQGMLLVSVIGIFYVLFVKGLITRVVNKSARVVIEQDREKNVILNEFITGIKAIKVFQNKAFWHRKFAEAVDQSVWNNFKVNMGRVIPDTFVKFTFFMVFAAIGIMFSLRNNGNIIIWLPLLGTFATVASRLFPYMNMVGNDIVSISRFMPDTKIVHDLLEENIATLEKGTVEYSNFKEELLFHDVSFRYEGMQNDLLRTVSFSLEKGKTLAIVGPSGSGKSTIISLLFRLYDIREGNISIDGYDIKTLKTESFLSNFGYVGQETFIFNGTIAENIQFGLEGCSQENVIEAAKLANAHEFILETENGYQTIVGDAGMKLSGGQRQRIAIARAMLRKPQILILDEATSSLDNISEKAVQEAINQVSRFTTTLIVAHRLSTVQKADKILVLNQGRIVEQGTHEELLQRKADYFELYTMTER